MIPLVSKFLRMYFSVRVFYLWFENFYVHIYKLSQMSTDAVPQLSPNCSPTISQFAMVDFPCRQLFGNSEQLTKVVRVVKVVKPVFNVVNLRFFCEKRHLISESAVLTLRLMR